MDSVFLTQSATVHQNLPKKFPGRHNAQCTGIAAYAIGKLCRISKPVSRDYLDNIVCDGDKYYVHCVRARDLPKSTHIQCEDLVRTYAVNGITLDFDVEQIGEGHFSDRGRCVIGSLLSNAVQSVSSKTEEYGILFIGHGKTVSCVPLGSDKFWVFNSHCVDANNRISMVTARRSARLFRCLGVDATACCLFSDHVMDDAFWQI